MSSAGAKALRLGEELLQESLLYREFHAAHEEILRHKWLESEKVGHDIGFDLATVDWNLKYRSQWRRERHRKQPFHLLLA